ncbi:MAG: HTTM domain-containing protein [Bacteroidota bacterium]
MFQSVRLFLGTKVDNSPLVVFRIVYGFLLAAESIGAIFTGWVNETFIEPTFNFTIIGLEWLQPLEGNGMMYYFMVMGIMGILMSVGLFYKTACFSFFSMWTIVYMMQKSHYNNHYYLLILLTAIMFILPAHKNHSLDIKWGLTTKSNSCERVCYWLFILQIMIVYVFASIHKMNPDWIAGRPLDLWFKYKTNYWLIGPLLGKEWMPYLIAWGGIAYDGLIVFLLLGRKTRKMGFILSIIFNLFNSVVFRIGIFPYLMILLSVFFFPQEDIRKIFFRKKAQVVPIPKKLSWWWIGFIAIYFFIQLLLPIRHHFYEGEASWTEEGHRLAWRMMLRRKSGIVKVEVENKKTRERKKINLKDYLIPNQISSFRAKPDMIWQFAQYLKREHKKRGEDIAVYVDAQISLNGRPRKALIDPNVDLASQPWEPWRHSDWILTYDRD